MKNNVILKLALALSAVIMCMPAQAQLQQTCNANTIETAPESRFTINNNQTVTDQATGLIWKRCSQGQSGDSCAGLASGFTWPQALQAAQAEVFANQSDWRLPNIKELTSIVEYACRSPAINLTVFPNTPQNFWSASPDTFNTDEAWSVSLNNGLVFSVIRDDGQSVRLVRGGQ